MPLESKTTDGAVILMKKTYNESFDDAKDRAEDICLEKKMPVRFCAAGFWYTIEQGDKNDC
jgi:hypothetical protein